MKRGFFILFLAFFAVGLFAQETIQFFLKNETSKEISQLFITKSSTDLWGDEVLKGNAVISPNKSIKLSLAVSEYDNLYDFKFINNDGDVFALYEIKVTRQGSFSIKQSDFQEKIAPLSELKPEEIESYSKKSALPKNYISGYQQGYLNGYSSGFEAGVAAARNTSANTLGENRSF